MTLGASRSLFLLALTVAAVAGVGWQRARSPFLRIAAQRGAVARIADGLALAPDVVCAGWHELGAEQTESEVFRELGRFAPLRKGLGEEAAIVALTELDAVVRARAAVGADDEALWARLATPERRRAVARFAALRARFAAFLGGPHTAADGGGRGSDR